MMLGGVSFRVCLHLGLNPGAVLTTREICELYNVAHPESVRTALNAALQAEYIVNASEKRGRGNPARYAAGPRLLRLRATAGAR